MQNKSILLVADASIPVPPDTYGGIERIVDMLAETLSARGWEVTLACHPDSRCSVNMLHLTPGMLTRWNRLQNITAISSHIRKRKYSIVHSFGHIDLLLPLWPFQNLKLQSFQSLPNISVFQRRLSLIPRKNMFFTVCGHHMEKHYSGIAPTKTIHNGLKLEQYKYQACVAADAPFVFLGRIDAIKGTHHAIRIANETGRRLLIAGNISPTLESKQYYCDMILPELTDRITYVGAVNDSQKNDLLGGAAALLMPIEWDEPFGIVMIEALACGTPVIGVARGALPEIVKDGVTGSCCHTIDQMIQSAYSVSNYSRFECRREVETRFSSNVITSRYEALYEDIINRVRVR